MARPGTLSVDTTALTVKVATQEAWAAWSERKETRKCQRDKKKNLVVRANVIESILFKESAKLPNDVRVSFAVPDDFGISASPEWVSDDNMHTHHRVWSTAQVAPK